MCTMEAYIAGKVLGAYTQYQGDKAQADYINSTSQTKAKNLANEAIYKDNAFIREKEVKEDQLIAKKEDIEEKKLKVLGSANVQFFEKGIGGNIYNSLFGDIERSAGKQLNRVDQNYENYILANSNNRLAWNRKFTNQIFALPRAFKPSWATYAIGAATDIAVMNMNNKPPDTGLDGIDYDYYESGEHY